VNVWATRGYPVGLPAFFFITKVTQFVAIAAVPSPAFDRVDIGAS